MFYHNEDLYFLGSLTIFYTSSFPVSQATTGLLGCVNKPFVGLSFHAVQRFLVLRALGCAGR